MKVTKTYQSFGMRLILIGLACLTLSTPLAAQRSAQTVKSSTESKDAPHKKSAAYEWLDVALEATAREHVRISPRPTVGSRMLMIITTAMYDAWAAYDEKAVGTRLGDRLRRPKSERTAANKEKAIAYATYRAMLDVFAEETEAEYECKLIQTRLGQTPTEAKLTCDVALDLPTFSATAEMAGLSRVMGGYHIQADNIAGLELGRKVANFVFPKTQSYFEGTVPVR